MSIGAFELKKQLDSFYSPLQAFCLWEERYSDFVKMKQPFVSKWEDYTMRHTGTMIRSVAQYHLDLGLKLADTVSIISKNCREWLIADLAIAMAGLNSVPIFPNQPAKKNEEILKLANIMVLFIGKLEFCEPLSADFTDLPKITFPNYEGNLSITEGEEWFKILETKPLSNLSFPALEDIWTIIYTSGTTGTPKGVEIKYQQLSAFLNSQLSHNELHIFNVFQSSVLSHLPLNHIAERMLNSGLAIFNNCSIHFVEYLDTFSNNLKDAPPHLFSSVPRIYIKIKETLDQKFGKVFKVFNKIPLIRTAFRSLILRKIGIDRAFCVSGSAVLAHDIKQRYFQNFGLILADVYGQTESSSVISLVPKGKLKMDSVGKPLTNIEVKIDNDSQELLYKSDWIMDGYFADIEGTNQVFTPDGFIRSSDKARWTDDGFIQILGRVKENFKTEKGKYITSLKLENKFMCLDIFEHICLVWHTLSQLILMLVPNQKVIEMTQDRLINQLSIALYEANKDLTAEEKVNKIVVFYHLWDQSNDMFTPTFKAKRNQIIDRYLHNFSDRYISKSQIFLSLIQ